MPSENCNMYDCNYMKKIKLRLEDSTDRNCVETVFCEAV